MSQSEDGEGRGRSSPEARGDKSNKMPTAAAAPRMRSPDDQSRASKLKLPGPPPTLMMEVWASVASWFFRPETSPLTCTSSSNTNITSTSGSTRSTNTSSRHPADSGISERNFSLAPTICTAIRCTVPSCTCECFTPGKHNIRYCDSCNHSWVPHALDKLGFRHLFGHSPVEPVQPNVAFDIASLVLYGCQALPIRLKILLDRLFSVLQRDEVLQVLHGFGWTHEDYARGYILQEPHGGVLDRWNICSPEEEPLVLQQFLRFGETRAITQQLLLAQQELGVAGAGAAAAVAAATAAASSANACNLQQLRAESDIKKFIERTAGRCVGSLVPPPPPQAPSSKPPGLPPPPPPTRDREREREREREVEGDKMRGGVADYTPRHKTPSRASPPTSLHVPPHHPPPLNLGLHPPPPHPPVSHASLPPNRPPPPPPISPLQKNLPLNFLKMAACTNGPITTSSPPSSISSSPLSVSPLNKLQSMQPFDFRKMGPGLPPGLAGGGSPEMAHRRRASEADASPPGLMNLSLTSPTSLCLPPPMPPPPASTTSAPSFNHHAAVMMSGPLSAASLMASSLPGFISSASPLSKSPSALGGGGSSEFGSEDDDDEENSHSALNLSRDAALLQHHSRPGRPPRHPHLRKASAPAKRGWGGADLPLNLGTQLINPATGKKRVQCNVCLKTFCDKGALKIHFSAVHLREMHKCTVEGCNMMFSSRRSRNRHSANPNPKLHSPHLRRKISPHDGRTAQTHPLLIPPPGSLSLAGALNPLSFSPFPLLTPPPDLRQAGPPGPHGLLPGLEAAKHSLDLSMQRYEELRRAAIDGANSNTTTSSDDTGALGLNNHHTDDDDVYDDDEEGIVVDGGVDDDDDDDAVAQDLTDKDDDGSAVKRVKLSESDMDEEMVSNLDSNDDSLSVVDAHSLKEENGVESTAFASSKSVRKRKNQNPTRCAVPAMMEPNVMSDDDSSDDVVFTTVSAAEENAQDIPSNSTDPKNEQAEVAGATIKQEVQEEPAETTSETKNEPPTEMKMEVEEVEEKKERPASPTPTPEPEKAAEPKAEDVHEPPPTIQEEEQKEPLSLATEDKTSEEKVSEDAAMQVKKERSDAEDDAEEYKTTRGPSSVGSHHSDESLDSSHALRHLENLTHGPFGDLLLARAGQAASPLSAGQHPFPGLPYMMGGPPSPARSQGSSGASNEPDSPSDDGQGIYFHDTGFMSNMDVPIDKDNPRRCTACGKIFQNHFGVKTHFQNVHLKLMHKCMVEGCNAAFPSKRSRDRHSANLNLHRKLLSTSSSEKGSAGLFMDKSPFASLAANPSLHSDFLARLYAESQALPLNLDAFKGLPPPHLGPPPGSLAEQMMLNGDRLPPPHPSLLLPPLGGLPGFPGLNNFASHLSPAAAAVALAGGVNGTAPMAGKEHRSPGSATSPASPRSPATAPSAGERGSTSPAPIFAADEELAPTPDPDTGLLSCVFCRRPLADAVALRDHYERDHPHDLFRCAAPGCVKAFTTRERRDVHCANAHVAAGSVPVSTPALPPPPPAPADS